MSMVRDVDGYWTGDVKCDALVDKFKQCDEMLVQAQIREIGLFELGWHTSYGQHYCPKHRPSQGVGDEGTSGIAATTGIA